MTSLGFVNPTPIQARCVPIALMGKDLCACAATGTGELNFQISSVFVELFVKLECTVVSTSTVYIHVVL